eukprot:TRINITY_DN18779_c0_g1_i2.p1 TRINITY_DN18779_c0_g1~~TRINITY_DN18779_c0_g1_i2.p1  ORF type:complete len:850 (-),score=161.28 TRINITY_DN18779_c0_g1_i2:263-2812(-)
MLIKQGSVKGPGPAEPPGGTKIESAIETAVLRLQSKWVSIPVLLCVTAITVLCALSGAFNLHVNCSDDFEPNDSLGCYDSYQVVKSDFPSLLWDLETLYIQNKSGPLRISYAHAIVDSFSTYVTPTAPGLVRMDTYWNAPYLIRSNFVGPGSSSMVAVLSIEKVDGYRDTVQAGLDAASQLQQEYGLAEQIEIVFTGPMAASQSQRAQPVSGGSTTDYTWKWLRVLFFVPVIMISWCLIGSLRLLVIPTCSVAASLICSWGVVNLIAVHQLNVPTYQPAVSFFLAVALSTNYAIFLLTRWQEERTTNTPLTAVSRMLTTHGWSACLSGSILVVVWLALCFFPVFCIAALGLCSAITVAVTLVVNLLLTPTLLVLGLPFFSAAPLTWIESWAQIKQKICGGATSAAHADAPLLHPSPTPYEPSNSDQENQHAATLRRSWYYRLSFLLTRSTVMRVGLPLLVITVMLVGCVPLLNLQPALVSDVDFGDGDIASAYNSGIKFKSGQITQRFGIVVRYNPKNEPPNVQRYNITQEYFLRPIYTLVLELRKDRGVLADSVQSTAWLQSSPGSSLDVLLDHIKTCMGHKSSTTQICSEISWLFSRYANFGTRASMIVFSSRFNPFTEDTRHFTQRISDLLHKSQDDNFRLDLYGPRIGEQDAEAFTMNRFAWVLMASLVLVFTMISVRYQAALIPLKLSFTMVVPIVFVYGIATGVFQEGWFSAIHGQLFNDTGIMWLALLSTIFLLIGCALDYEILLFSRVHELRRVSVPQTREAVNQAMALTGPVISGAGLCTAFTLVSMVASESILLNQIVFIALLGILVDVFIVRLILAPCVLSTCGWLNWCPTKMPIDFE